MPESKPCNGKADPASGRCTSCGALTDSSGVCREAEPCGPCDGSGYIRVEECGGVRASYTTCGKCHGTGRMRRRRAAQEERGGA